MVLVRCVCVFLYVLFVLCRSFFVSLCVSVFIMWVFRVFLVSAFMSFVRYVGLSIVFSQSCHSFVISVCLAFCISSCLPYGRYMLFYLYGVPYVFRYVLVFILNALFRYVGRCLVCMQFVLYLFSCCSYVSGVFVFCIYVQIICLCIYLSLFMSLCRSLFSSFVHYVFRSSFRCCACVVVYVFLSLCRVLLLFVCSLFPCCWYCSVYIASFNRLFLSVFIYVFIFRQLFTCYCVYCCPVVVQVFCVPLLVVYGVAVDQLCIYLYGYVCHSLFIS